MPKEVISPFPGHALVLKWGREQDTGQIGVEFGGRWFRFVDEPDQDYNSLWFSFETREDYNRAIRTLRKMRDAQCGKDA